MAAEAAELKQAAGGSITDTVADWLGPQYLLAARDKLDGTERAQRWEIWRAFAQDWAMLRRGDQNAGWLRLEREKVKLLKKKAAQEEKKGKKASKADLTPEEREAALKEIYGR